MFDENCGYDGWYEEVEKLGIPDATPMQNVWLGVTAENQRRADERIPILLDTPAAVRGISLEPMLGPVVLSQAWVDYLAGWTVVPEHTPYCCPSEGCAPGCPDAVQVQTSRLDWVICGPETGPGKRPFEPKWAALLRNQCVAADVPYFDKRDSHAGWREFPRGAIPTRK